MTHNELSALRQSLTSGAGANWRIGGVVVAVVVQDVRQVFGRVDVLVKPMVGLGSVWVALDTITAVSGPKPEGE